MGRVVVHLSDVYVNKGYEGADQAKFTANQNSEYGSLSFKASYKRYVSKEESKYENFSISWRGVKGDSPVIGLLNAPGVRVCLHGDLTQDEYQGNKFIRVSCEGRNAVVISKYGEDGNAAQNQTQTEQRQPETNPVL